MQETMNSEKELKELQLDRLKHIVAYAYENVKMYKERFDKIGAQTRTYQDAERY